MKVLQPNGIVISQSAAPFGLVHLAEPHPGHPPPYHDQWPMHGNLIIAGHVAFDGSTQFAAFTVWTLKDGQTYYYRQLTDPDGYKVLAWMDGWLDFHIQGRVNPATGIGFNKIARPATVEKLTEDEFNAIWTF